MSQKYSFEVKEPNIIENQKKMQNTIKENSRSLN